jgi:4a-hydroxytetrahydrobiopterin dehydratase
MKKMTPQPNLSAVKKSGWVYADQRVAKTFVFQNFDDAFAFMTRCALAIAKADHHPEWFNVYNKVHVELTTHDAGGVTAKDCELAVVMDKIATAFPNKFKKKAN